MRNISHTDKLRLSLLAIFCLAGCDRIVQVQTFPEQATLEQNGKESCAHPGYCYGMSYTGKWGWGFGPHCPGSRTAVVKHIPARRTYESGRVETYTVDTTILVTGNCQ